MNFEVLAQIKPYLSVDNINKLSQVNKNLNKLVTEDDYPEGLKDEVLKHKHKLFQCVLDLCIIACQFKLAGLSKKTRDYHLREFYPPKGLVLKYYDIFSKCDDNGKPNPFSKFVCWTAQACLHTNE